MSGIEQDMAPLIVLEERVSTTSMPSLAWFGSLELDDRGQLTVNTSDPVVYVRVDDLVIHGSPRPRPRPRPRQGVTYVWFFFGEEGKQKQTPRMRGIRCILGEEGFPLVWAIHSEAPTVHAHATKSDSVQPTIQPWFISQTLEDSAKYKFGKPQGVDRLAVDRALPAAGNDIVIGAIEDGPIPMGPYVYVAASGAGITILLCRCSPQQVQEITETVYYELQPLEALNALTVRLSNKDRAWLKKVFLPTWLKTLDRPIDRIQDRE